MVFSCFFLFSSAHHSIGIPTGMSTPLMLWTMPLEQKMSWRGAESQEKDAENPMDLLGQWSTNMFIYMYSYYEGIYMETNDGFCISYWFGGDFYTILQSQNHAASSNSALFFCADCPIRLSFTLSNFSRTFSFSKVELSFTCFSMIKIPVSLFVYVYKIIYIYNILKLMIFIISSFIKCSQRSRFPSHFSPPRKII